MPKHHLACLTQQRSQHQSLVKESQEYSDNLREENKQGRVFAELVTYIDSSQYMAELSVLSFQSCAIFFKGFPEVQAQRDGNSAFFVVQQGMQLRLTML